MGRFPAFIMSLVILLLFLFVTCSREEKAQPPVNPSPAKASSPESAQPVTGSRSSESNEMDKIIAAARKEGRVSLWAVAGLWEPVRPLLAKSFKEKYGIDIQMISATSQLLNERLFRERKAGIFDADIILASGTGALELKKADVLDRLEPNLFLPEVTDPKAWMGGSIYWVDQERSQLLFAGGLGPYILINTNLARAEEIRSMHDLLNPKWKGKLVMYDPTVPGPGRAQFMVMVSGELGPDYLRELIKQEPVITRDPRQHMDWLSRGVYPVLLGFMAAMVTDYQKTGAPVQVVPPPKEAVFYSTFASIITTLKNAPHPNAAKLFANWILSREGQMLVTGPTNTPSRRIDVPSKELVEPALVPDTSTKYRMMDNPEEIARYDEYQKKVNEIFVPFLRR